MARPAPNKRAENHSENNKKAIIINGQNGGSVPNAKYVAQPPPKNTADQSGQR